MEKSIIIIGGGLTGLSSGCYGRMNGYKTTILEMHSIAGGVATAWKRKGFTIDGAMNWLVGTKQGAPYYEFFEDLGAAQAWKIHNHDRYSIGESPDGTVFTMYCDADQFEEYLVGLAPEDEKPIHELTEAIRIMSRYKMKVEKPPEWYTEADFTGIPELIPYLEIQQKWAGVTWQSFAEQLKKPYLRRTMSNIQMPLPMTLFILSLQHAKWAGYVLGGALALVEPIEKRYRDLGGEIVYKARVKKILVEDDKAVGVQLEDGTEYRADWVISAADGHATIYEMLEGKYTDEVFDRMYAQPILFPPLVYVGLGVNRTFDEIPSTIGGLGFALKKPVSIAGAEYPWMNPLIYNFDPSLAPEGKTSLVVSYATDFDYWANLYKDQEAYKSEKERICDDIITGLEERFPGITDQVEMRDIATPVTWVRYTGNWRGSYEGWMYGVHEYIRKTLPGLDNLYMAGQWVNAGGGMCSAVMSGNHTIQMICADDGNPFITLKP